LHSLDFDEVIESIDRLYCPSIKQDVREVHVSGANAPVVKLKWYQHKPGEYLFLAINQGQPAEQLQLMPIDLADIA
jgi:hypothetical protein